MKAVAIAAALALAATGFAGAASAGCVTGAVVGGVGAHYALHGRHTVLGAVAGCAVGHHMAVEKKRRLREERRAGVPDPHHHW